MHGEPGLPYRSGPMALFLTWTTYGSWLPGDDRGWCDARGVMREPSHRLALHATHAMRGGRVQFGPDDRRIVEAAIQEHCRFRGWQLHAVHCRTTHVHAVLAAGEWRSGEVLRSLKAWCSRELSSRAGRRPRWWSRGGSKRLLYDTAAVVDVVTYVLECQDRLRG
jgi:REP element-mobilizing transposase RayT